MRVKCFDNDTSCKATRSTLPIRLFGRRPSEQWGAIGQSIARRIQVERFDSIAPIRDFLRIGLAVVAADHGVLRSKAQDGWTREIELEVPVEDATTWRGLQPETEKLLRFLTGDIWTLKFKSTKHRLHDTAKKARYIDCKAIALLSGGADSLVGALDLAAAGEIFATISQTSSETVVQELFSRESKAKSHLAWTHGLHLPFIGDGSQRARSMGFFAFALIAATSTTAYRDGETVDLHASENGLISLNPALTPARVGSASTRTTHPCFVGQLQAILDRLDVAVRLRNNYQTATKGEMFRHCVKPAELRTLLPRSMSCGKSRRRNMHCGRCVPCLIRRAAFRQSGIDDVTIYQYGPKEDRAGFESYDDVRSAFLGSARHIDRQWIESAVLPSLFECPIDDREALVDTAQRGLKELHQFLLESLS